MLNATNAVGTASEETTGEEKTIRPKVRPKVSAKVKPVIKKPEAEEQKSSKATGEEVKKSRPVMRPKISAKVKPVMIMLYSVKKLWLK